MTNYNSNTNPTSSNNFSKGYLLGDTWFNMITYDRFTHVSDGVWTKNETESDKLKQNIDTCQFYYINGTSVS